MADKVTLRFKTERLDSFVDRLVVSSVGANSFTALALRKVVKEQLLPKVRQRTPVGKKGAARAGWKIGREFFTARRPFITVVNSVFYIRFLEWGTLARRRKKLARRKGRHGRLSTRRESTKARLAARRGGIRPIRMLGTTVRDLRAANAVPEELKKMFTRSAEKAARKAERIAV